MMTIQRILLTILLLTTVKIDAQSISEAKKEALTQILYQHANDDSPGMAVGIVQGGTIVYESYVGYANLEYEIKIDKDTRFNIASNAKQFTALSILRLEEQGKINLEDDIRQYLPNLYPDIQDNITISQLLTHTSGVRDYCDLMALQGKTWWKQFIDNSDAMELIQNQKDLNFKPGTEYLYSNSNYILLTEIIKKATDQDFSAFTTTMFEDLDMANSNFHPSYGAIIRKKARPYGNWNGWFEEPTITEVHGDGALFTTLPDQLKWEQILQVNDGHYLSQQLVQISQSPIENSFTKGYGYGLMFDQRKGLHYSYHVGATGAYNAAFLRFPANNTSIVIMSNNRGVPASYVAWQLAYLVLDLEENDSAYPENPDRIDPLERIEEVVGIYKGAGEHGTIIKIIEKAGALYREIYQIDPVKLIPEKDGLFEYETIEGLKINFTNIGKSDQQFTLYRSTQKPRAFLKISNLIPPNFDKNALDGRFYNDETGTEIILKFVAGHTYRLTKNGRERPAELIMEDYLRMNSYKIKIVRDQQGQVIGLNVKNNRIKNVIFNKS